MSTALQLANPPAGPDAPNAAVLFANVTPLPVMFLVWVVLRRAPEQPAVRVIFRGLHISTPDRMHVLELRAPATTLRTSVLLYAPASAGDPSRAVTAELDIPGSQCELQVTAVAAYDA